MKKRAGMTLVETMIVLAVSAIVVLAGFSFWVTASKNWAVERLKSHMEQQIEVGIEKMKKEIRVSTADPDEVVFYGDPETNNPPYEAISFPIPKYSDSDLRIIERADGDIAWGTTVIYHVYNDENDITELRRTVFNNRADLTKEEREDQLSQVVADGNGANACCGDETTDTKTVFTNLVTLAFEGSSKFDGYNPSEDGIRSNNVGFGSALLAPGLHNLKLQVIGKNSASSGYGLGVDYVSLSPSGAVKEGEDYFESALSSGGTLQSPEDMYENSNGVWSGNYQLEFASSSSNSYVVIPIYYDEWRETNFNDGNILWEHTKRDQTTSHDYIIRLEGNEKTWDATSQTGAEKVDDAVTRENQYIRIRIPQECLSCSGSAARIKFSSNSNGPLKITSAYFGVSDSINAQNFDASSMAPIKLQFGSNDYVEIPVGGTIESDWFQPASGGIPPLINKNSDPKMDYLVSFHIENNSTKANCAIWNSSENASYVLNLPTALANPETDNWVLFSESTNIIALEEIYVSYVSSGSCVSQQYNTYVDDDIYPAYQSLSINSVVPSNTNIVLEFRAGDNADMSDATSWSSVISGINGRQYVQFRAALGNNVFPYLETPEVKNVYINWDPTSSGEKRLVDFSGYFTMRPDYGILKVLVDDEELVRGIEISIDIQGDVVDDNYNSHITAEVYPRNTGR